MNHKVLAATKNTGVRSVSSRFAATRIPVLRPSAVQVAGHVFFAGGRRVVMLVVPPVWMGLGCSVPTHRCPEGPVTKSGREIMEIFEAFDLTGTAWSAAQLAGCDAKTVARYVAVREAGGDPLARTGRPRLIDAFMPKVEELVDRSKGKIRADVAHRKIAAMGYRGSERSTRRAVAEVKEAWRAGRRRRYRPWIAEPGMWLQWDWGDGPQIRGRKTQLFSAWLAWSRFRVVIPVWDQQLGTLTWYIDQPGAWGMTSSLQPRGWPGRFLRLGRQDVVVPAPARVVR
jgi:hypothetical protein